MRNSRRFTVLACLSAVVSALAGCGYVGEPQPPLANIPAVVTDLAAVQRGGRLLIRFSLPKSTTEHLPITNELALDLRIMSGDTFNPAEWDTRAQKIPQGKVENGVAQYDIPSADWAGKDAIISVRTEGPNGKPSDWSGFVVLPVVPPLETPHDVALRATPDGVLVSWQARGESFRVLRKAEGETDFTQAAVVNDTRWTDAGTDFGKRYAYKVQTIAKLPNGKEAESEFSSEQAITPRDAFPPGKPTGLRAAPTPTSVELSWDPNPEAFVGGYRVYRSSGGAFEKIADVGMVPSYSDAKVEAGKTYRYQVSAVSKTGYESSRSDAVEAALP
jgi:hypothetical protein